MKAFPSSRPVAQIQMDRQAQALVLENIRSQIANRWQQIVAELRRHSDADLGGFLEESGIELSDILRRGSHSWTRSGATPGYPPLPDPTLEEALLKRVRAFAHVDDRDRAQAYRPPARRRRTSIRRAVRHRAAPGSDALLLAVVGRWRLQRRTRTGFAALKHEEATGARSLPSSTSHFEAARHVTVDLPGR